jgi:hypothetical protein
MARWPRLKMIPRRGDRVLGPDAESMLRLQQISTLLINEGSNGAIYKHVLDAAIDLMSSDTGSMQVFHRNGANSSYWPKGVSTLDQPPTGNAFVTIPPLPAAWRYPPDVGSWC